MSERELLLEFRRLGHALRVAAIDPDSLLEVVFQVPLGTPREAVERLAAQRLAHARAARARAPAGATARRAGGILA